MRRIREVLRLKHECALPNAQIAAVLRNELGHIRRRHLPLRLALIDRAAAEPRFASRFRARLQWIALAIAGLYILALAAALA